MKNYFLLILLVAFTAFIGCQKDIALLGYSSNDSIVSKDSVFIRSITLVNFPKTDPSGFPWDTVNTTLDSADSMGPDIFYYIQNLNLPSPNDTLIIDSLTQATHFQNVNDSVLPLTYTLTKPFQLPDFYYQYVLKIYDFEIDESDSTSSRTLMDSIPFTLGVDTTQANPYKESITLDHNGFSIVLGLQWE